MKRRKKIKLQYKKERVVFSDILPYELPIIFSNRYFYRFLVNNKIAICNINSKDCNVSWSNEMPDGARFIMAILMNMNASPLLTCHEYKYNEFKSIPFVYNVQHKPTKPRQLAIVHPINQIKVVEFYNKYKDAIIYLCSKSNFSMRKPQKVASYFFYKDRLHHILLGRKTDKMEMYFKEYENLKTFFSYKKYTNIYKFYEDYRYQRAEKKYQHLLRTDIQSCFDSIYTHSIAWAVNGGANIYKDNFKGYDMSIGCVWDKMMQEMNYNETNGIVIGPEFSRIFAEVILQQIDTSVERELLKLGYIHKVDYECYRYVDDYFFFFNDEKVKEIAIHLFQDYLKEYKLNLSQEKTVVLNRPFITNITKAKIKIDSLIQEYVKFYNDSDNQNIDEHTIEQENIDINDLDTNEEEESIVNINREKAEECINSNGFFKLKSTNFNRNFKAILIDNDVNSKDVLNYTIARLAIKLETSLKAFDKIYKGLCLTLRNEKLYDLHEKASCKIKQMEKILSKYLYEVLDVLFFMYSNNKRINTTLKVMQVLNAIIIYLDNDYIVQRGKIKNKIKRFSEYGREIVFKKIRDEISLVLKTSPIDNRIQLETLYFLITLRSMNKKYRLVSGELITYLNIEGQENGNLNFHHLNAIAIILLLYYIGNEKEYISIKDALMRYIKRKFDEIPENRRKIMSEFVILSLDLATCPYINPSLKYRCLEKMGLNTSEAIEVCKYLKRQKYMFTKWTGVNITKELNAKISQEVYS